MSEDFKILMISNRGPELTVFESQVLDVVRAWRKYGDVSLLYRSKLPTEVRVDGVKVTRVGRIVPEISELLLLGERLLNSEWSWEDRYDFVHCRGAVGAWQVLRSMNKKQRSAVKVLYDCRGIVVEEMEGAWEASWKKVFLPVKIRELRKIEEYVVNEVDMLTTVSDGLSDYLEHNYGRRADRIIRPVVNSEKFFFSNSSRESIRISLGLDTTDILFIFVGGGDYWQSLDLLKKWWCGIRRSNFSLLILTHTPNYFDEWIISEKCSAGQIIVKTVPHTEVSSYMSAADYGVLFREEGLVNNVASPVKLSEYLCTGLQVITNLQVYQQIRPDDMLTTNLSEHDPMNTFSTRDISVREIHARNNLEKFSAENAVKEIYEFVMPRRYKECADVV